MPEKEVIYFVHACALKIHCFSCNHMHMHTQCMHADQDECALGFSSYCSHSCLNIPGSFRCKCPPGYILQDLYTCGDLDECVSRTDECDQASGATCQNSIGSYVCKCPDGYIMDDSGRSCIGELSWVDLDLSISCYAYCNIVSLMRLHIRWVAINS